MTISGYFLTNDNEHRIDVTITCDSEEQNIIIGNDNNTHIYFDADPVNITLDCDDTFNHILTHRATINLVTDIWLGDYLFADNNTDIPVQISYDNQVIFDGYIEHNTYNQGFANTWENISINCIDRLQVIEYQTLADNTDYNTLKSAADIHTFKWLLQQILGSTANIYFDGSRRANSSVSNLSYYIFNYLKISDNTWLGETQSDIWTKKAILEEMMRYLNLHIVQMYDMRDSSKAYAFYIFDWDYTWRSANNGTTTQRFTYNIRTGSSVSGIYMPVVQLGVNSYASTDTNITMGDVYNKIVVSTSPETIETIIDNPLDTEDLTSPYLQSTRYMTEFFAPKGKKGFNRLRHLIVGDEPPKWDASDGFFRHWYMRYLNNPLWTMKTYQVLANTIATTTGWTPIEHSENICSDNNGALYNTYEEIGSSENQWTLPKAAWYKGYVTYDPPQGGSQYNQNYMTGTPVYDPAYPVGSYYYNAFTRWTTSDVAPMCLMRKGNCIGATLLNFWSTGKITANDSSTPQKKENNSNWLVISTNNIFSPQVEDDMVASGQAICTYTTTTAASMIPTDDDIHYYLVFSGKIALSPFIVGIYDYQRIKTKSGSVDYYANTSQFKYGGKDEGYYAKLFYDQQTAVTNLGDYYNQTTFTEPPSANPYLDNIDPFIEDDGIKRYEYKDYRVGDTIEKVGVLLCSLRIGDKYLNETTVEKTVDGITYSYPSNQYEWTTDSTATFTIGFDPKLGDYIVGQKYDIGSDISVLANIDATKGQLIEISRSDAISGNVEFKIISPMSTGWDDNYHRHRTWFRRAKDWTNCHNIFYDPALETTGQGWDTLGNMKHLIENIYVGELKCTLYSDNGGNDPLQENDIIYMSDEENKYVETKDDIEFKFMSGLTQQEANNFGITSQNALNFVLGYNDEPITQITTMITYTDDNGVVTKPEKLYCTQYFNEYHLPKLTVETTLKYSSEAMYFKRYQMSFFQNKTFYPLSMETNLKFMRTTIRMKEY